MAVASPDIFSLQLDDHRIVGEKWASAEATASEHPDLVLLHGGGQTRHSWKGTAMRMSALGWNVYALDARGHGDSDWHPRGDYSIEGFCEDLRAFVATLDSAPVLVGASLGGMTALVTEGEHPNTASALVLVDIVVRPEPEGVTRIRDFLQANPDGFADLEAAADAIAAYNPLRPRPKKLDGLRKNLRQWEDGRWYWHWDPAFIVDSTDEPRRRATPQRLEAAARNVKVPTLLVRGLQSDVVSDQALNDTLALIPQAQVAQVGGAGHMIAGDDNDVFTGALGEFLSSAGL